MWCAHLRACRDCNPGQLPPWSCSAGSGALVGASGAAGTLDSAGAGAWAGACGTAASPAGASGTAGTEPMMPMSCCTGPPVACSVAYQAMARVMMKNTIASHLVALVRKLDDPREPNTVAEAPPPKPEPAAAPEPRCMRISTTMEIATRTDRKSTRLNSSHV